MTPAVRLVFSYDGGEVALVSRQHVEMTLPATYPIGQEASPPEFAAELRGADGQVLHMAQLPNPLASHREVFSDDPDRSIHRVPVERPSGVFTVVVPDHPEGDHVALVAAGARDEQGSLEGVGEPHEIARVPLRGTGDEGTAQG
jgi:hypothetical protein